MGVCLLMSLVASVAPVVNFVYNGASMARKKYYSIGSYVSFIATFKWRFFLTLSLFILANIALTLIPVFVGQLTQALTATTIDTGAVYFFVIALILASVGHDLLWRSAEFVYLWQLNARAYDYEDIVFHNVINRHYPYFVGKFTGKIGSYIGNLGNEFRTFLDELCYSYVDLLVKLPALVIIMFSVNTLTGLIFISSIVLMVGLGKLSLGRMNRAEQASADAKSNMDGYVIDIIANFVSVKAFKKETAEYRHVQRRRMLAKKTGNQSMFWAIVFWGLMSLVVRWIVWPATILLNIHLFLQGQLSIAQITTFLSAIVIFSDYIWTVVWNISQFSLKLSRIEESYRYLFDQGNIVKEFKNRERQRSLALAKQAPKFEQTLELKDVSFAYPDQPDQPVLDGINLTIKKNEKIGIVGTSGSGKTTLTKLLLGYYDLSGGEIIADDKTIQNDQLVHLVSYVPQDTSLFHKSIAGNIAYGADRTVTQADIERAAKRAHAHEFINKTVDSYEAVVGERGIKLSMGQRQRIAIARAFLDDKPLLVLDEATSALDSQSEVLVQEALEDLWHDKTVIAIAHRLSTLRNMDRIIVMEQGRILEHGSHQQLLKAQGAYYRLWQHQSNGML